MDPGSTVLWTVGPPSCYFLVLKLVACVSAAELMYCSCDWGETKKQTNLYDIMEETILDSPILNCNEIQPLSSA
jgi:hypothetical protein